MNELVVSPGKQSENYESLVSSYENAVKDVCKSILEVGNIISKAFDELGEQKWKDWLKDERINLNITQAYKFKAVSKFYQNNLQLTEGIKSIGIEKAYLLTKIEDEKIREDLAGQIIDAEFTVNKTRQIVKELNNNDNNISTEQVIEKFRNLPPQPPVPRSDKETGLINKIKELKGNNKILSKKNEELKAENEKLKARIEELTNNLLEPKVQRKHNNTSRKNDFNSMENTMTKNPNPKRQSVRK